MSRRKPYMELSRQAKYKRRKSMRTETDEAHSDDRPMMDFAVVTFPEEDDSLGVIPTNWIVSSGHACLYPRVTSDFAKNILIYNRQEPTSDWKEFKIRILKKYEKYDTAKAHLSDAEITSNIESECDTTPGRKRPRNLRKVVLPGESSSSEDEGHQSKKLVILPFTQLPTPPEGKQNNKFKTTSIPHLPTPSCNSLTKSHIIQTQSTAPTTHSTAESLLTYIETQRSPTKTEETQQSPTHSPPTHTHQSRPNEQNSKFKKGLFSPQLLSSSWKPVLLSPPLQVDVESMTISENVPPLSSSSSSGSISSSVVTDIVTLKQNQELMWDVLSEFSSKLDRILGSLARIEARSANTERNSEDGGYLENLPLNKADFSEFEDKLHDSTFRQKIVRILSVLSGNNVKSLSANIMRRLLLDDVAEEYSLTGKPANGVTKKAFHKTRSFTLVCEICFRKFKDGEESKIREGISDWLMQAKFRRIRREKRLSAQNSYLRASMSSENKDLP